jgi:hypothetical protein
VRDTLERGSPSDSLSRERPEDRCREPRVSFKKAEESSKRNRRNGAVGERGDGIQRAFEEAPGKTDEIPWQGDIQNLAAAVVKDSIPDGDACDQHEQPIVFSAFRDDFAIARDRPNGRLEITEDGDFFGRERNKPGELVRERGRETWLPRVRRLRRHLRSRLWVGARLGEACRESNRPVSAAISLDGILGRRFLSPGGRRDPRRDRRRSPAARWQEIYPAANSLLSAYVVLFAAQAQFRSSAASGGLPQAGGADEIAKTGRNTRSAPSPPMPPAFVTALARLVGAGAGHRRLQYRHPQAETF